MHEVVGKVRGYLQKSFYFFYFFNVNVYVKTSADAGHIEGVEEIHNVGLRLFVCVCVWIRIYGSDSK